jgi:hypothetical protein
MTGSGIFCYRLSRKGMMPGKLRVPLAVIAGMYTLTMNNSKKQATELLDKYNADPSLKSRSSLSARLTLFAVADHKTYTQDSLVTICKEYYQSYGGKSFAFQDLRPALESLDEKHSQELGEFIDTHFGANSNPTEILLFTKTTRLSPIKHNPHQFLVMASESLDHYQRSLKSPPALPEAILIAVLDLIHLSLQTTRPKMLLTATLLLELGIQAHKDYTPLSILLITLQRHLGLLTHALSTFTSLSIKNLQWETVGHHLLTRISTLHPHAPSSASTNARAPTSDPNADSNTPSMDASSALDATLNVADKLLDGLASSVKNGLREASYTNVLDAVSTRRNVQRSLWRRIAGIEERKVNRLVGDDAGNGWWGDGNGVVSDDGEVGDGDERPDVIRGAKKLVDLRDLAFLPAYAARDEAVYGALELAPARPAHAWLAAALLVERIWGFLGAARITSGVAGTKAATTELRAWEAVMRRVSPAEQVVAPFKAANDDESLELTVSEIKMAELALRLVTFLRAVRSGDGAVAEESISAVTACLDGFLGLVQDNTPTPTAAAAPGLPAQSLHALYTALEAGQLVSAVVDWVAIVRAADAKLKSSGSSNKSKGKKVSGGLGQSQRSEGLTQNALAPWREKAGEIARAVAGRGKAVKTSLARGGVLGELVDGLGSFGAGVGEGAIAADADVKGIVEGRWKERFEGFVGGMGGEAAVEVVVGRWLEGWEEAADGLVVAADELGSGIQGKK